MCKQVSNKVWSCLQTLQKYHFKHCVSMSSRIVWMCLQILCKHLFKHGVNKNFLTYLHYVSKYSHTMYEDLFTQRHSVDGIFTKCLNPYSFKITPIVLVVDIPNKLGLSWAKLSCQLGFRCTIIENFALYWSIWNHTG